MTVAEALRIGTQHLTSKGLQFPRQDSELMLASVLGTNRTHLFAHPEIILSNSQEKRYKLWLEKRGRHYPIQYLRGVQEFYGRQFRVTPGVLIPRPETEVLVDTALRLNPRPSPIILDIGTGSGCIAITLACEIPDSRVVATDISSAALQLAGQNAAFNSCHRSLHFLQADLCAAFRKLALFDLVTANPPYISTADQNRVDVSVLRFEPHQALFAGEDGLFFYTRLLSQVKLLLRPKGFFLLELGEGTQDAVRQLAQKRHWKVIETLPDLAGIDRCLVLQLP